ncbi:NADP-dependent oxidoreductase [Arthrobacter sp. NPDC093128]|uniref:NADP-dependent oxidoreductase n=1 Tax=Arthrobacter sp. NPDC093128 TaxID=3154979 RepID=UPI00342BF99C
MKAVQINQYGDNSVLELNEIPEPAPEAHQLAIDVRAAALNPLDTVLRAGYLSTMMPLIFPATLGGDVAGIVTAVGRDVTTASIGDHVYGQAYGLMGNSGAFAEHAVVDATHVHRMPACLSFTEAASMGVAGTTAVDALTKALDVQAGQKVLITGGSGAVGSIAVQIAKHLGAYVAATASGDGVALAKGLGADEVFDYRAEDIASRLTDYDAVLDTVGSDALASSYDVLRRGGRLVTIAGRLDEDRAAAAGITTTRQAHQSETALSELTVLIEDGVVTPRVGDTFRLEAAAAAFKAMESRVTRGKVVILP